MNKRIKKKKQKQQKQSEVLKALMIPAGYGRVIESTEDFFHGYQVGDLVQVLSVGQIFVDCLRGDLHQTLLISQILLSADQ